MQAYTILAFGLCKGRHEIPGVSEYIFGTTIENPMDFEAMEKHAIAYLKPRVWDAYNKSTWGFSYAGQETQFSEARVSVKLYVTGLTPALIAVIKALRLLSVHDVYLMHFDRESGTYLEQSLVW